MKKKKRIIKWIALGVVLTGIVALAVVAGMGNKLYLCGAGFDEVRHIR